MAEQVVNDIPDPEIKSFERLVLAVALLGGEAPQLSVIAKFKQNHYAVEMP